MKKIYAHELVQLLKDVPNVKCLTYGNNVHLEINSYYNTFHFASNIEIYFSSDANYVASNGNRLNFRIGSGDVGIYFGVNSNTIVSQFC